MCKTSNATGWLYTSSRAGQSLMDGLSHVGCRGCRYLCFVTTRSAPRFQFSAAPCTCIGIEIMQRSPVGSQARRTVPRSCCSTTERINRVPKPCWRGDTTGESLTSRHSISSCVPPRCKSHVNQSVPEASAKAPYLAAFVASSWSVHANRTLGRDRSCPVWGTRSA